jgi:hypothetical protein
MFSLKKKNQASFYTTTGYEPECNHSGAVSTHTETLSSLDLTCDYILPRFLSIMSALVQDSPDRAVTAIEALTGSDNYATWKRLMTSYLKARQVWDVVSGDLQRPDCQFKYAKPITADITPLVEPHLNGAVRQRAIEARLEAEVQAFERHKEWSRTISLASLTQNLQGIRNAETRNANDVVK